MVRPKEGGIALGLGALAFVLGRLALNRHARTIPTNRTPGVNNVASEVPLAMPSRTPSFEEGSAMQQGGRGSMQQRASRTNHMVHVTHEKAAKTLVGKFAKLQEEETEHL